LAKAYANHPWSVTEPEAVGVPGWQIGALKGIVPLQLIPTGLQASPQGTDLADNSLGGVECSAHHPGSRGVADIVSVTMPLLSIKDTLQLLFPQERGLLRINHRYINTGRNRSRLFVRERVEL